MRSSGGDALIIRLMERPRPHRLPGGVLPLRTASLRETRGTSCTARSGGGGGGSGGGQGPSRARGAEEGGRQADDDGRAEFENVGNVDVKAMIKTAV